MQNQPTILFGKDELGLEWFDGISQQASLTIREAIAFMDARVKESLSLPEVAEYVNLNPSYLSVLFKEQTSVTFSEYLMRRKVQEAKKLLVSSGMSIDEVAAAIGYQSPKYFIKLFKQFEGTTPGRYRRQFHEKMSWAVENS